MTKTALISIAASNYLSRTAVLFESAAIHLKTENRFLFLFDVESADSPVFKKYIDAELIIPKNLFDAGVIKKSLFEKMMFYYTLVEAATALKPFVLLYLFQIKKFNKLLYLDPDMMLYSDFSSIWSKLDSASMVLTPHLIKFSNINKALKHERDILRTGIFNLGFLALRKNNQTISFLNWWAARLVKHSTNNVSKGLFTDQKWVNLAIGVISDYLILRSPGVNLAFWNLHERVLQQNSGKFFVDYEPLILFHFSGFNSSEPLKLTVHDPSNTALSDSNIKLLVSDYASRLHDYTDLEIKNYHYKYSFFNDGSSITQRHRWWSLNDKAFLEIEEPFAAKEQIEKTDTFKDLIKRFKSLANLHTMLNRFPKQK